MKYTLTLKPNNIKIKAEEGTTISDALMGYSTLDMVCGGKGICGKCKVYAIGNMSPKTEKEKDFPEGIRLACTTKILGDVNVYVPKKEITQQILTENFIRETKINNDCEGYGIAFDIGSTTLAAYLLDLNTGKILSVSSAMNPQIIFGDDLIARINYINENEHGLQTLQSALIRELNKIIDSLCYNGKADISQITKAVFVGNTCMNHITLGIDPHSLGEAPYEPTQYESVIKNSKDLNLNINGKLYFFPNIAGFVGGDTVAVILSCMKEDSGETVLAVDIGTNGEMALRHKGKLYVCSAAAGPAFEGGGISCGMRGGKGAVDKVYIENNKVISHVIGDGKAEGICGSGLVDLVAALLKTEDIDESGYLEDDFEFANGLKLLPKDVRNLQLAKGSIGAAIKTLLSFAGITEKDLDKIYIAGGFGNYLNKQSAVEIGLLPNIDLEKIISIGNGAGAGAVLALINTNEWDYTETIRKEAQHVELAHSPDYQMNLMDAMMF